MHAPRETSGVTTALIVRHLREHGGADAVDRALARAGETRDVAALEDAGVWSTYAQKIALFEAAAEVLADPLVARRIGEGVLDASVGSGLKVLLRATGSPAGVLRNIARAAPKLSTVCTMQTSETEPTSAVVTYQLHDGHEPSAHDCAYNMGLLSQVAPLFGLPAARVEHGECQVRGADRCVYLVRWRPRVRWWRGSRRRQIELLEDQLETLARRAESLQLTAADLVSSEDVATVLRRIVARAAETVSARGHLLAVRGPDGEPQVHAEGLSPADASRIGLEVLLGHGAVDDSMLVVDVTTSHGTYGQLVALGGTRHEFFEGERRLLATYARHAAVAIEVAMALEEARTSGKEHQQSEQRYRSLFERNSDAIFSLDLEGRFVEVNPAAERVSGYAAGELVGHPFLPLVVEEDVPLAGMLFTDALEGCGQDFELRIRHREGHRVNLAGTSFPVVVDSEIVGVYGIVRDVTVRRQLEREQHLKAAELSQLAFSDPLTRLPNRAAFLDRLEMALRRPPTSDSVVAVLFVDLDDLKAVNDTAGHASGDALLVEVAARLRGCLRPDDLVARLGGDEFAVLLDCAHPGSVPLLAERLRASVAQPLVAHDGVVLSTTASIGVAVASGAERGDVLLRRADAAMYEAKGAGKDRFALAG